MGSLAAGSAAAIGTGAISSQRAPRHLTGQVVSDANAYTEITSGDANGAYAEFAGNGELYINFGNNGGANGLNPDSLNYFKNVFEIRNFSDHGPVRYYIERDGPNMGRVSFFNTNGSDEGPSPDSYYSITGSGGGTGGDSVIDSQVSPDPSVGKQLLRVDVRIDLRDSGLSAGDSLDTLFGSDDNFVIVGEQP